jgi:hypothetical protein
MTQRQNILVYQLFKEKKRHLMKIANGSNTNKMKKMTGFNLMEVNLTKVRRLLDGS